MEDRRVTGQQYLSFPRQEYSMVVPNTDVVIKNIDTRVLESCIKILTCMHSRNHLCRMQF